MSNPRATTMKDALMTYLKICHEAGIAVYKFEYMPLHYLT